MWSGIVEGRQTAPWSRVPAALPEDISSTPNIFLVAHDHLYLQSQPIPWPLLVSEQQAHPRFTAMHGTKTPIHLNKNLIKNFN